MEELYSASLPTDHPPEELRLTLVSAGQSRRLNLEVHDPGGSGQAARGVTLPLSLWPRFREAVCCLGAFMKPLPAPAYQARSCCSYNCPQIPETVVLELAPQHQLYLSFQDRRGSTFLEIKTVTHSSTDTHPGVESTIRIGPSFWSAFLSAVHRLAQIIADL